MPKYRYRAPGIFTEPIRLRPRGIRGVETAFAGLVGPTHSGPLRGRPAAIGSFLEFEHVYGNAGTLSLDGRTVPNHTALAAQAFFRNGGERLFVVRTLAGVTDPATTDSAPMGAPLASDYAGRTDPVNGSTGLAALEELPEISLVLTPAAAAGDPVQHRLVIHELQRHCQRMRHRIGLVDPGEEDDIAAVRALATSLDDSRLALYYPWVIAPDPTGLGATVNLPPSGFVAGVYARNDRRRGVHKAPAGLVVSGALGFTRPIDHHEQSLLNPEGVNCLRTLPQRGHVVWGARTLSRDPEWRYVNVRRYLIYLERSVETSVGWIAAEPNGEPLWASLRTSIETFLDGEWRAGRLQGTTQREAYFVRCDRSTMSQADIDHGRVHCDLGIAALRPSEFLLLRLTLTSAT